MVRSVDVCTSITEALIAEFGPGVNVPWNEACQAVMFILLFDPVLVILRPKSEMARQRVNEYSIWLLKGGNWNF